MELKIWIDGIQKIVCGVTLETSCQDVIFALAHATGRTGKFTLLERWRNNERVLSPHEQPLAVLSKWGEHSTDVQFILQHCPPASRLKFETKQSPTIRGADSDSELLQSPSRLPKRANVGIVRGVPKLRSVSPPDSKNFANSTSSQNDRASSQQTLPPLNAKKVTAVALRHTQLPYFGDPSRCNPGDTRHRNNIIRPHGFQQDTHFSKNLQSGQSNHHSPNISSQNDFNVEQSAYRNDQNTFQRKPSYARCFPNYNLKAAPSKNVDDNCPSIENNEGPKIIRNQPPPYREPPPPTHQLRHKESPYDPPKYMPKRNTAKEFGPTAYRASQHFTGHYGDLLRTINTQKEQLRTQQAQLTRYDAEINYWENKNKEQREQMDAMALDASFLDQTAHHLEQQVMILGKVEDEADIVRQQDRTLKSEMTLLRSKLANCETELLLCRNKIRLLMEEIHAEQIALSREKEERTNMERSALSEVERLQVQVEQAARDADVATHIGDSLRNEVSILEATIIEKKRQVEKLVADMKDANLQSLAIAPCDELSIILQGAHKPGSSRKMIGSPRQLENAVPTNKNPHGVWV